MPSIAFPADYAVSVIPLTMPGISRASGAIGASQFKGRDACDPYILGPGRMHMLFVAGCKLTAPVPERASDTIAPSWRHGLIRWEEIFGQH
jgi:hypothetical protein